MTITDLMDICEDYCRKNDIKATIPCCNCNCKCCWCFVMCIACCQPSGVADYMRTNVNRGKHFNNEKLIKMGFKYRNTNDTMKYVLDFLRDSKFIPK